MTNFPPVHVEARGIQKNYGGVQALKAVTLDVRRGEVHALIGENGAGKSTLGKIIAGSVAHDGGELYVDGEPRTYRAPAEALRDGIAIIDQELALLPERTVIDNVFLGMELAQGGVVRKAAAREQFAELNRLTGFDLSASTRVGRLRLADQQKVEIMRALARNAELIVMDEPSASLTPVEVDQLHAIIRSLKDQGTTVIIVSHFLEEVLAISDRVSILRDGRYIRTADAADETQASLVHSMLGREHAHDLSHSYAPELDPATARVVLEAEGLTRKGVLSDISLTVRAGEIVGLSGLVGSGRTEVCRAIFGADPLDRGTVRVDGTPVKLRSPAHAIDAGIALLPESRKEFGLVMLRSVKENVSLARLRNFARLGVLRRRAEHQAAEDLSKRVGIKYSSLDAPVSSLSGGNQQKVVLGRWMLARPKVLIVDEPTRGVDVGAKAAIYELIREAAQSGVAVLVVSSEIEEILALTHRVHVMSRGRLVAEFETAQTTKDQILEAAFDVVASPQGAS